jgi:hypothetical protein
LISLCHAWAQKLHDFVISAVNSYKGDTVSGIFD